MVVPENCYICGMGISEKILRRVHPGRVDFGEDELSYVDAVVSAYNEERAASGRVASLPGRFVAVGEVVSVAGHAVRCVPRPDVWPPCEACRGCALSRLYLGCGDLQCSVFDRRDGSDVWFVEETGVGCE